MTPEVAATPRTAHGDYPQRDAACTSTGDQRVTRAEAFKAFFPDGAAATNDSPLAAAWQWWHAVLAGRNSQAAALSANPADWGDFGAAAADLRRFALVNTIDHAPDMPDCIAYARLILDTTGQPVKVAWATHYPEGRWITIIRRADRWFIWGVSDVSYRPPSARIFAQPCVEKAAEI